MKRATPDSLMRKWIIDALTAEGPMRASALATLIASTYGDTDRARQVFQRDAKTKVLTLVDEGVLSIGDDYLVSIVGAPERTNAQKTYEPTREELMECLAEGQARVHDYFFATVNLDRIKHFPHEEAELRAKLNTAMTKLMEWSMSRDDVNVRPDPLKAVWEFRLRMEAQARDGVIEKLEKAVASLKAQQPKPVRGTT